MYLNEKENICDESNSAVRTSEMSRAVSSLVINDNNYSSRERCEGKTIEDSMRDSTKTFLLWSMCWLQQQQSIRHQHQSQRVQQLHHKPFTSGTGWKEKRIQSARKMTLYQIVRVIPQMPTCAKGAVPRIMFILRGWEGC
jgi:hypothetical protein